MGPFVPLEIKRHKSSKSSQEGFTVDVCRLVEYDGDFGSKFRLLLASQSSGGWGCFLQSNWLISFHNMICDDGVVRVNVRKTRGFLPLFSVGSYRSVVLKLARTLVATLAPGVTLSWLGLVVPVSAHCDWLRWQVLSLPSVAVH